MKDPLEIAQQVVELLYRYQNRDPCFGYKDQKLIELIASAIQARDEEHKKAHLIQEEHAEYLVERCNEVMAERDALQAKLNILEREHREAIAKLSSERDALSKERDDMQADFNWLTEEGCFRNERFIVTHESWNTFRPVGLRTCIAKARSGVMGEYLGPEVQPAGEPKP